MGNLVITNDQRKEAIRVSIICTTARSGYLYGPILKPLSDEVTLVAVWGRTVESAKKLGVSLGVPWYTKIGKLVKETTLKIGIVRIAYDANGTVGLMAVQIGKNILLETPIAHKLSEAGSANQPHPLQGVVERTLVAHHPVGSCLPGTQQ